MYYILFYSFKYDPNPCNILEKLRECVLESICQFLLDLLHEPNQCMLTSGQRKLVAPLVCVGGLVLEISTLKGLSCFYYLWPKFSTLTFFSSKA